MFESFGKHDEFWKTPKNKSVLESPYNNTSNRNFGKFWAKQITRVLILEMFVHAILEDCFENLEAVAQRCSGRKEIL